MRLRKKGWAAVPFLVFACRTIEEIPPDCSQPVPVRGIAPRTGTFAVFGDTQQWPVLEWFVAGGPKERRAVRDRLREVDPDLVLLAGDVVGAGWVEAYWKQFAREFEGLPVYPTLGNHDLMGSNRHALTFYFRTFPNVERRRWYEIRRGGIAFLLLDSNRKEMSGPDWEAQTRWLEERLRAAEADPAVRSVALVSHHPPISASTGGGSETAKRDFYDRASSYPKFRVYFAGHHHAYQHLVEGPRHTFVTGGGGAPQFFKESGRLPPGTELVRARKVHHVLVCREDAAGLVIEMQALGPGGAWTTGETVSIPF